MESKYTIGLLLGSCVLLVVAVAMTLAEILQYSGEVPQVRTSVAQPGQPAAPAEGAAEADESGAAEEPPEAGEEAAEEPVEGGEEAEPGGGEPGAAP